MLFSRKDWWSHVVSHARWLWVSVANHGKTVIGSRRSKIATVRKTGGTGHYTLGQGQGGCRSGKVAQKGTLRVPVSLLWVTTGSSVGPGSSSLYFRLSIKLVSDFERMVAGYLFPATLLACAFSCYIAWLRLTCFPRGLPPSQEDIYWKVSPLTEWLGAYRDFPDAAHKKVAIIREVLPAANFSVVWIESDPYLIVTLGDEDEDEYVHWWKWAVVLLQAWLFWYTRDSLFYFNYYWLQPEKLLIF